MSLRATPWTPTKPPTDTVIPPSTAPRPVEAVARLDLERFAGLWHEIARLPVRFQREGDRDIIVAYEQRADGSLGVHGACTGADGRTRSIDGTAVRPEPQLEPAQLRLRLAPRWLGWLPAAWRDYWVIALDEDYRWAVIGEPKRRHLWILGREPQMPRQRFDELKARARRMGYDLAPLIVSPRRAG